MTKKSVLGVDITIDDKEYILEHIKKYLNKIKDQRSKIKDKETKPFVIFTPNPEIITYAQKDDKFKQIVNSSQINIPDGMGIVWALKKLYGINVKRLSGADLMLDLCKLASERSLTIGLIGGRDKVALRTRECLLEKYPNLKVKVFEEPEVESDKDTSEVAPLSGDSCEVGELESIDILFVALGFPKQEYFIDRIQNSEFRIQKPLVMLAVGGTFDYLAGKAKRAPEWMRDAGFEWFYRLVREPYRLPRHIIGAEFFIRMLTSK